MHNKKRLEKKVMMDVIRKVELLLDLRHAWS